MSLASERRAHLAAQPELLRAIRRGIIEAGQDTAAPDFGRVAPVADGAAPGA